MNEAGLIFTKLLLEFYQKSYIYWLITLFDYHFTKQILLINFRNKSESSKPKKQPKITFIYAKKVKPKLFGYLLAQQVTSNNDIDFAYEVEPVQNLNPNAGFYNIL